MVTRSGVSRFCRSCPDWRAAEVRIRGNVAASRGGSRRPGSNIFTGKIHARLKCGSAAASRPTFRPPVKIGNAPASCIARIANAVCGVFRVCLRLNHKCTTHGQKKCNCRVLSPVESAGRDPSKYDNDDTDFRNRPAENICGIANTADCEPPEEPTIPGLFAPHRTLPGAIQSTRLREQLRVEPVPANRRCKQKKPGQSRRCVWFPLPTDSEDPDQFARVSA